MCVQTLAPLGCTFFLRHLTCAHAYNLGWPRERGAARAWELGAAGQTGAASRAKVPFLLLLLREVVCLLPGPKPPAQFVHFLHEPLSGYTGWSTPKYLGEATQPQFTGYRSAKAFRFSFYKIMAIVDSSNSS